MTQQQLAQQIEQLQAQIDKLNDQYGIVPGCTVKCVHVRACDHGWLTVDKLYKVRHLTGPKRCVIAKDDEGDENDLPISNFVRATEEEIAAANAKPAKPIKFGTHVRTYDGDYGRVACDGPDEDGEYLIARRRGGQRYSKSEYYDRENFTVLSRAPRNKTTK